MARRPRAHEEELPFVALMDTMTNVVGVLIIVLVMIGIGLAKTVKKILSDLPMVSIEEHQKLKDSLAEDQSKRDPTEVDSEMAKLQEQLRQVIENLQTLETEKKKNPTVFVDLEKLKKELEAARKERMEKKALGDRLLAEIDQLKLKLDTTPAYHPPPGITVRLPSPKPMPEKAELQRVFVSDNKLLFVQNEDVLKLVEDQLRTGNFDYSARREPLKDASGKIVMRPGKNGVPAPVKRTYFNATKLADFFAKAQLGNRDVVAEVGQVPNSPLIQVRIIPRPNGGETIEQARRVSSNFRSQLQELKSSPNAVIWFQVTRDSIATYLAARDITDQQGIPVGWEFVDKPVFAVNVSGDYLVDFTPPPKPDAPSQGTQAPPPAPAPKPAGPPPVRIAPPKMSVD